MANRVLSTMSAHEHPVVQDSEDASRLAPKAIDQGIAAAAIPRDSLFQHIEKGNQEAAKQIIAKLFQTNPALKLKDFAKDLRSSKFASASKLASKIDTQASGTGIGYALGRLTRAFGSKSPEQRIALAHKAVEALITELQSERAVLQQQHPALQIPLQSELPEQAELKNQQAKLDQATRQSNELERALKAPEAALENAKSALETTKQALERFNRVRLLKPAQREEQLKNSQEDSPWKQPLQIYRKRTVAKTEEAQENQAELEYNYAQSHPNLREIAGNLRNYIHCAEQEQEAAPRDILAQEIKSSQYELELTEAVLKAQQDLSAQEALIKSQKLEYSLALSKLKEAQQARDKQADAVKQAHLRLNWQGYKARSDLLQAINKKVFDFNVSKKKLETELEQNKNTNALLPTDKKEKENQLAELSHQLNIQHNQFRTLLLELERYNVQVGIQHDELYPKDGKPYPTDPGYTAEEIAQFWRFDPVKNPLFTGGKNYKPSIRELVRDYQLARQGITLTDAYSALWQKIHLAADKLPKELKQYDAKNQTDLEKMLTLSALLQNNTVTTLVADYPLECVDFVGNIRHAYEIFNRSLTLAGDSEGAVARIAQEYKSVAATVSTQNFVEDALVGQGSPFYSSGRLREIDPALLAAIDFSKYLPYLAALLVPSTGSYLAKETGVKLAAKAAIATTIGVMSRTQAAWLVGTDIVTSFVPESVKQLAQGAKELSGVYAQVRGEQLAMENLRYQAEVKGSRIAQTLLASGGYEQALRDAVFYGHSKDSVRQLGGVFRAAVTQEGIARKAIAVAGQDWVNSWKQNPLVKATKTTLAIAAGATATVMTGGLGAIPLIAGIGAYGVANKAANTTHNLLRTAESRNAKEARIKNARVQQLESTYDRMKQNLPNAPWPQVTDQDFEVLAQKEGSALDEAWDEIVDREQIKKLSALAEDAGVTVPDIEAAQKALIELNKEKP